MCLEWANHARCKNGENCRFRHGVQTANSGHAAAVTPSRESEDIRRFAKQLVSVDAVKLKETIARSSHNWMRIWDASSSFEINLLKQLIETLAKIPFSAHVPHPPLDGVCRGILKFVEMSKPAEEAVKCAEIVLPVVSRLLKFEWTVAREDVRGALLNLLAVVNRSLDPQIKEHRTLTTRIFTQMEEMEKPWIIQIVENTLLSQTPDAFADATETESQTPAYSNWRHATIGWLTNCAFFQPSALPVAKVPGSKSGGLYESKDEYLDTWYCVCLLLSLFVGFFTFLIGVLLYNHQT